MTQDDNDDAEKALIRWMKSQEINSVDGISIMLKISAEQMGLGATRKDKTRDELIEGMHKLFSSMLIIALDSFDLDPDRTTEA